MVILYEIKTILHKIFLFSKISSLYLLLCLVMSYFLKSATRTGGMTPKNWLFGMSGDTISIAKGEVSNLYNGINNNHLTKKNSFENYKKIMHVNGWY